MAVRKLGLFSKLLGLQAKRNAEIRRRTIKPAVELLENRSLLAAVLSNGVLKITGTESGNTIVVEQASDNLHLLVRENGVAATPFLTSQVTSVSIDARGGNDTVQVAANVFVNCTVLGGAGKDLINTGSGNDTIDGGTGNDTINSGSGNDTLRGSVGNDILSAGTGNDFLYGGDGNDNLDGGSGVDVLEGAQGRDILFGQEGNDTLKGGYGNDSLYGGSGDDVLGGDVGDDILQGGDNDDLLYAALGADQASGGSGTDVFVTVATTTILDGTSVDEVIGESQLIGNWFVNDDRIASIAFNGSTFTVKDHNGQSTSGRLLNSRQVKIDSLSIIGSLEATALGTRIRWTNGVIWERPAVEGTWFVNDDKVIKIQPNGSGYNVTDPNGQVTTGRLLNNHQLRVDSLGITGSFETSPTGTRIRWTTGVVWERPAVEGTWFVNDDKLAKVRINGAGYEVTDQNGKVTTGRLLNNHQFRVDSQGITGSFETSPTGTRIRWTNGVIWERPAVEGKWFVGDDQVTSIHFNGSWFGLINESGQETSGRLLNNHQIKADGWGITGSFETSPTGTRIRWTNGVVWERPALAGKWFVNDDKVADIQFNGNWFTVTDPALCT